MLVSVLNGAIQDTALGLPAVVGSHSQSFRPTVKGCASKTSDVSGLKPFHLEYIADSGAGRDIGSHKAFQAQGVPLSVLQHWTATSSHPISFEIGGGVKECKKSIGLESGILGSSREVYCLDDSPLAMSLGINVIEKGRPFVWQGGESVSYTHLRAHET